MRKSDEYRTRLEEIDGKLRRARQGRGRRREQMLMLLDQLEAQYRRQKQELTGAWAEIDRLETLVEGLEDRLEKIAEEFEKDSRQTEELIGRIARMDGVLKTVGRTRTDGQKAPARPARAEPPAASAETPPPAAPPPPSPAPPPPAPSDGADRPSGPAANRAGDAVTEQERRMPRAAADLAGYAAEARDRPQSVRMLNRKA
jgi:cell division septum initiation protein DivIVA